jgi:hypothetical protein
MEKKFTLQCSCYNSSAIFNIVTQSFLYFIRHFLDFASRYSDSAIFATVPQSFFAIVTQLFF